MQFIKQNTSGLYLHIQKIGCFFISCVNVALMITGEKLKIKDINWLWDACAELGYIDKNQNITNSAKIINKVLEFLGSKKKVREVATFAGGVMCWYASVLPEDRHADFYIQKIKQGGPSKTHFRNVTNDGKVIEDPHDPPIKALDIYYTICYRLEGE